MNGTAETPTAVLLNGVATYSTASLAHGTYSVAASYNGDSNFTSSTATGMTQTVNDPSTMVLSSVPDPSSFGQSVTYTATVNGSGATPTGTVTFLDDGSVLNIVGVNGSGVAIDTPTNLNVATHTITAIYSGDSTYAVSNATLTGGQTVSQAVTTSTVVSSNQSTVFGQPMTFTATVTGQYGGTPSGTVTFKDNGTPIGTGLLNQQSTDTATFTPVSSVINNASTQTITAVYAGNINFTTSTGTLTGGQTVTQASTSTVVTSSLNPSGYTQTVTFTATVAVTAPGAGVPTGTVTFKDGTTSLGTGILNLGSPDTATLTAPSSVIDNMSTYVAHRHLRGRHQFQQQHWHAERRPDRQQCPDDDNRQRPGLYGAGPKCRLHGHGDGPRGRRQSDRHRNVPEWQHRAGTGTLSGTTTDTATLSLAATISSAGTYSITAVYGGDTNFAGGTAVAFPYTVDPATLTWTGTVSANWNAANWTGPSGETGLTPMTGDSLVFPTGGGNMATVDNITGVTFNSLMFQAAGYTVGNATNTLSLSGGITSNYNVTINTGIALTANQTWSGSSTLTVSGTISGAYNLTEAGSGTLTLSGNNTYSGGTTVTRRRRGCPHHQFPGHRHRHGKRRHRSPCKLVFQAPASAMQFFGNPKGRSRLSAGTQTAGAGSPGKLECYQPAEDTASSLLSWTATGSQHDRHRQFYCCR